MTVVLFGVEGKHGKKTQYFFGVTFNGTQIHRPFLPTFADVHTDRGFIYSLQHIFSNTIVQPEFWFLVFTKS